MSQENVELVRRVAEAWNSGGIDALLRFFPDDVIWYPFPDAPIDSTLHGHDGIREVMAGWSDSFDHYTIATHEIRDLGEKVVALGEVSGLIRGSRVPVHQPIGMIAWDFRGATIGKGRFLPSWEATLDAAALPEDDAGVPGVSLRRATAADAQAIGAVYDSSVRAGWTFLGDLVREPLFTPEHWDELVAAHAPPNALLVATDAGGRVVGYTAVHADDGELFLLFVDPAYAGRGIGRVLLDAAHDALRAAGRSAAFLFTDERNERALTVYARAGYRPDGSIRESDFRGVPIREKRLVKPL